MGRWVEPSGGVMLSLRGRLVSVAGRSGTEGVLAGVTVASMSARHSHIILLD